ncbi:MAG: hypothetical protein LJE84_03315 [Gammaproteobacteria bacterium]|jgi:intracellular sulfur oxidation DsrE/DsrF family protein|nr:hypothetical protein [Gammaproteobacteria bacterium]
MKFLPAAAFVLIAFSAPLCADTSREIDALLKRDSAPAGVLFEIVSGDRGYLAEALPRVIRYSDALRKRFPDLPIAVVSHGYEQFALTTEHSKDNAAAHESAKVLSLTRDIPVHVCAAFAATHNVDASEFPEYVDVVSQGPTQVQTYVEFGYEHIVLDLF